MKHAWCLPVLIWAAACGKSGHDPKVAVDNPTGGGSQAVDHGSGSMNPKTPGRGSKSTFVRGASLTPADKLVTWLDSQQLDGKPRLLRLPIVLPKGPGGYDISKARLGPTTDALEVYANDASLGVGLGDRARQACKDSNAPTCAFWVEAYWKGKQLGGLEIDVKTADVLPADQVSGATFAEVESESGN